MEHVNMIINIVDQADPRSPFLCPPPRLKRFAIPAFMIIATVRGFLLNFGVYYATRAALGGPMTWSPAIM